MSSIPAASHLQFIPLEFGSKDEHELSEAARREAGDWILPALKQFERIFVLRSPIAPGLAFVGAQASAYPFDIVESPPSRLSAGGTGTSLVEALISCMGEGLEFFAQIEREGDVRHTGTMGDVHNLLDSGISAWLGDYQPE